MYFKKIYMHGFKSFAEPVTIEFHPGITCIVGPNGSGKSNLSDAIRWVLGEQSAKSLRGGKMEDIIFNGTASRKSRGMAEVTLTIDNTTGILPIEYSEVAITRRMYRSGESEYSINGNSCRLRDIRELIMDTGIGVDGYSLIGQGKISEIVDNKTEGRRQIFEEAAGIVMYRTKKHDAERKLAASTPALERVDDIIAEIEGRIDSLKEDSDKASEYLVLREKFRELEINITLKNIEGIEDKVASVKSEIEQIEVELESNKKKKADKSSVLAEKKERGYTLDELSDELRKEEIRLIAEINELENKEKIDTQKLESLSGERERVVLEKADLLKRLTEEQENEKEIKAKLDIAQEKLDSLETILIQKTDEYNTRAEAAVLALEAVDEAKSAIFDFTATAQAKRSEARSYDSIKDTFKDRRDRIFEERKMSGESSLRDNLNKSLAVEKEASEKLEIITDRINSLKVETEGHRNKDTELRKKLEGIKLEKSQAETRKKTLEEMEANFEGYNYAVKYIMKQQVPGIFGTCAQLMSVPSGYEIAIETALGGSLSNIICSDDSCAKKAVEMLKASKTGRLTFLPISSIKHRHGSFNEKEKGFLGFACDIIDFDEKHRPAYEYLLGRTVIADTMDNAIAMSKMAETGIRIVTLDGDIIAGTGAITGGKYKNKTANLLERKAEVHKLEDKIKEIDNSLSAVSSDIEQNAGNIRKMMHDISMFEDEHKLALSELNDAKVKTAQANAALIAFSEKNEKWDKELAEIESKLSSSDEIVNALIFEALEAEKNAREAKEEVEVLVLKYEKKKEAEQKASDAITKARMDATNAEGEMSGIKAVADNLTSQLDSIRSDIEAKENRITEIDDEIKNISSAKDETGCVLEKNKEKETVEEKIELITKEREENKKELLELESELDSLSKGTESLSERKVSADVQFTRYETQLENLKDKLWDTFEISYMQALDFKRDDFVLSRAVKENRDIKSRMNELGDVNIGAIEEYAAVSKRYKFLTEQREDILVSRDSLNDIISTLDKTIKARFKESFNQVAVNFEEVFKELFGGGHAQLVLSDEQNPLESDIEIIAQPPEKKLQNINLLSGGEKTMTAIALMFAVLKAKPTPFCILDEVEAALDDDNMIRFAGYLKKFNEIQFALITHQKTTMEYADVLYGVTMPERGITKVLSLKLGDTVPGLE